MTNGAKVIQSVIAMVAIFALVIGIIVMAGIANERQIQTTETINYPEASGYVVDTTHTLKEETIKNVTASIVEQEKKNGIQIAVLVIPTLSGANLEAYTIGLAEKWKVGQQGKDDGIIFLVVTDDHKMRIEVGHGLEGDITDSQAGDILNNIVKPKFKAGDMDGGIQSGVEAIIKKVSNVK